MINLRSLRVPTCPHAWLAQVLVPLEDLLPEPAPWAACQLAVVGLAVPGHGYPKNPPCHRRNTAMPTDAVWMPTSYLSVRGCPCLDKTMIQPRAINTIIVH